MHSARSAREAAAVLHEREAPEFGAPTRSLHDGVVRADNKRASAVVQTRRPLS
jgi:hypothetical protein